MISQLSKCLFYAAAMVTSAVSAVTITKQPENTNVPLGRETFIEVQAEGQDPLSYQWYRDGILLEGATQSQWVIQPQSEAGEYLYKVEVKDSESTAMSKEIKLTVFDVAAMLGISGYEAEAFEVSTKIYTDMYLGEESGVHLETYDRKVVRYFPEVVRKSPAITVTIEDSAMVIVTFFGGIYRYGRDFPSSTNNQEELELIWGGFDRDYVNYFMGAGPHSLQLVPYSGSLANGYGSCIIKKVKIIPIPENSFLADIYREELILKGSYTRGDVEDLDFDDDGRSNLLEWMQSTNPFEWDQDRHPTITKFYDDYVWEYHWRRPWNIHPYTYCLEASTDMKTWEKVEDPFISEPTWRLGKDVHLYDTVPIGSVPRRFLRLSVIRIE